MTERCLWSLNGPLTSSCSVSCAAVCMPSHCHSTAFSSAVDKVAWRHFPQVPPTPVRRCTGDRPQQQACPMSTTKPSWVLPRAPFGSLSVASCRAASHAAARCVHLRCLHKGRDSQQLGPHRCRSATHIRTAQGGTKPKHTELTEAHKGHQHTNLVGRPRGLGFCPANGWAALSKHFGGYPDSAPTERVALPG